MRNFCRTLAALLALASPLVASGALAATNKSDEQRERIDAAFVLSLGRTPSELELTHWMQERELTITSLMANLRHTLETDPDARRAVVVKAWADAYGRDPSSDELRESSAAAKSVNYSELMQQHVAHLREHPDDYAHVVQRAYRRVVRRDAYAEEISYWKSHGVIPYALLAACIQDWARRNQPGLMVTSGTPTIAVNNEFLVTVRLSPGAAAEARKAIGISAIDPDASASAAAFSRNIIAAGADVVVSTGGIHFVAAGVDDSQN